MENESRRRFLLISQPRTASHLFIRILGLDNQPSVIPIKEWGYIFAATSIKLYHMHLRGVAVEKWTDEEKQAVVDKYQKNFDDFQKYADDAELQGKGMFIKEHSCFIANPYALSELVEGVDGATERPMWPLKIPSSYGSDFTYSPGNKTIFPDEFLRKWQPTFLIRHPARMIPSYYRAIRDLMIIEKKDFSENFDRELEVSSTVHWSRTLYEWYMEQKAAATTGNGDQSDLFPIVIDADDVINEPRVVKRYAEIIGLDVEKLRFTWGLAVKETSDKETSDDPRSQTMARMRDTLEASTGILKDKTAADIDIDAEAAKWLVEFGPEYGPKIERLVRAAIPDYEFLRARKLTC